MREQMPGVADKLEIKRLRKLWRLVQTPMYRRGLKHRVAAAVEHERVPWRHDFRTIIDVGANRGQFALFATQRFPAARIICFEPLPEARERLSTLLDGATIMEHALGASRGTQDLHITQRDDSSSLLPVAARQQSEFPRSNEMRRLTVLVARLDDVVEPGALTPPVLLKLDVQGAELDALRGGERTLRSVDELVVEASFVELYEGQALAADVIRHLVGEGFAWLGVYDVTYGRDGASLQADLHFARRA